MPLRQRPCSCRHVRVAQRSCCTVTACIAGLLATSAMQLKDVLQLPSWRSVLHHHLGSCCVSKGYSNQRDCSSTSSALHAQTQG
jgi:hypothetical protein